MNNLSGDAASRELHDQVGQAIAAGLAGIELAELYYEGGKPALAGIKLAEAGKILRWALEHTKRLAFQLRHPAQVGSYETSALCSEDTLQIAQYSNLQSVLLISREALTNAIRHSGGTQVIMNLIATPEEISAVVEDNGHGIDADQQHSVKSLGLQSMQERASRLGGTLNITAQPSRGTKVMFNIPLTST